MRPSASSAPLTGLVQINRTALIERWGFDPCPGLSASRPRDVGEPTGGGVPSPLRVEVGPDDWRAVHDARDPLGEARSWLSSVHLQSTLARRICVIGAGEGWIVDAIEQASDDACVLILEPHPEFAAAMLGRRDYRSLIRQGRLMVISAPGFEGAASAWRLYGRCIDDSKLLVHPVIARAHREAALVAARIARQALADATSNEHARRRFAAPYLLNTLRNLPVIAREADVQGLFDRYRGRPAVVAGAGPSLNRNLDELRPLRGRVVLIAADTALRPCLAAGLAPDFVVTVDPGTANARHLAGVTRLEDTALVAEPSVQPATFTAFAGRTFLFRVAEHHPWPWLRQAGIDLALLRAWGSVLVTAFDLGVRIGGDPVVLIGADLAYTNDQPYCRGTVYEEDWTRRVAAGESLSDIWQGAIAMHETVIERCGNDEMRTAPHFVQFRNGLLHAAQAAGCRVINATGAGILQGPGIEPMSVTDALNGGSTKTRPAVVSRGQTGAVRKSLGRALQAESARTSAGHARPEWMQVLAEHEPAADGLVHELPRVLAEAAARVDHSGPFECIRDVPAHEVRGALEAVRLPE